MLNFIKQLFYKEEPKQEELFFSIMNEKLNELQRQVNFSSDGVILHHYLVELIQQINRDIKELKRYIDETKIYIVFMGTTSAGKSTFINSLLGQQLLPSRNQECTQSILLISDSDRIAINDKNINNLAQAQQILLEMQKNEKFEIVNVEVPSVILSQLPSDLRKRIVFVDTPGIKMSEFQNMRKHFQMIDEKIQNHHRINIWIGNYTTFDSDKELQSQVLRVYSQLQSSMKLSGDHSYLKQVVDDSYITQTFSSFPEESQEVYLVPLFYILNKYDERKPSEDSNIEATIKQISSVIGSDSYIFKISALRALRYQIMNYGSKQSVDRFVENYFLDYREIELFQTQQDCRQHCEAKIKNNHNLIQSQDFQKFQNQLICQIKLQISKGFYGTLLNQIGQSLVFLDLVGDQSGIQIDQSCNDQLQEFIEIFIDSQIKNYKELINKLNSEIIVSIENAVKQCQLNLFSKNQDKSGDVIKQVCQETIEIFIQYDLKVKEITNDSRQCILTKLEKIFKVQSKSIQLFQSTEVIDKTKRNKIVDGCMKLYELLCDSQISEIQKQSFERYADDIQKTMGVKLNTVQKQVGLASTGLSILTFFGRRFILAGMVSPVFAAVGLGLMAVDFELFGQKQYYSNVVDGQLNMWKQSLISQIKELSDNYCLINNQTLNGIRSLLKSLLGDK